MFTTIEPRLIALLNDEPSETYVNTNTGASTNAHTKPTSPSLELPPLQRPSIFTADGRPLLLEPDENTRNGKATHTSNASLGQQHGANLKSPTEDEGKGHNEAKQQLKKAPVDRALGSSSPQSLRKILDDDTAGTARVASKKRLIAENNKDDFVQLPQPPKKHKAAKQVVPPIIIGLFEPPPQAALFPPIASSSFHDSHGRNSLNTVPTSVKEVKETSKSASPKDVEKKKQPVVKESKKRKDVRVRKKWTDEETNNLLLGVYKHGVGNWTDILEDTAFSFNERSGADLKDRFRTCCPAELRENNFNGKGPSQPTAEKSTPQGKSKSSLMSENILIDDDETQNLSNVVSGTSSNSRKSRAHRKKMEDLAQLGIAGPFRKSQRRERRPFTEDEDREILEGYNLHGPAWTKIQRDPRFRLQSRQPTDLRDRFRNKYPEKFRAEDKGDTSNKENVGAQSGQSSSTSQSTPKAKENVGTQSSQSSSTSQSTPKAKDNSDGNSITSGSQPSLPPLPSGKASNERGRDGSGKEHAVRAPTQGSSLQSFSSREGLRIQEIISSENEISKTVPLQPQTSLFGFKDNFSTFSDPPTMETPEGLPFSQSFDWAGSMTAPFANSMGEMDISRLLLEEPWSIDNPNSSGKEKQSLTDINSIISSGADHPNIPSFYNLLVGDPEQIVDLHESPFG